MEFLTFEWIADPGIWASLVTLLALEIVLGIDNLIFISILAEPFAHFGGFGLSWRDVILNFHIPKGYVYLALAFSVAVEGLNTWAQRRRRRARAGAGSL